MGETWLWGVVGILVAFQTPVHAGGKVVLEMGAPTPDGGGVAAVCHSVLLIGATVAA